MSDLRLELTEGLENRNKKVIIVLVIFHLYENILIAVYKKIQIKMFLVLLVLLLKYQEKF